MISGLNFHINKMLILGITTFYFGVTINIWYINTYFI